MMVEIKSARPGITAFLFMAVLFLYTSPASVHGYSPVLLTPSRGATTSTLVGRFPYGRSTMLNAANDAEGETGGDEQQQEKEAVKLEKATKAMTAFTNKYLSNTCTTLCKDKSIPAVVIKGLAEHKIKYGSPLCPCRFYDDKAKEAKDGYWNCPCVPMRERHECHCMLFLTEDNMFAGEDTSITVDEVTEFSSGAANN